MMRVSSAFPSKYLQSDDLGGKSVNVTIERYTVEEVGQKREQKPVLYFKGKDKGMVLNKTNANNIAAAYGDEMDDWKGRQIQLFTALVDFQGQTVEAIRARVMKDMPKAKPAPVDAEVPPDFEDEVPF